MGVPPVFLWIMDTNERYQIVETIAQGDFATVYRARDQELAREVAIKQIHQQYLTDPAQLDQYWKEAQLLASLSHPFVMTIYDVVRPRGWLVLELMKGNIRERLKGQACDLDYLRLTLTYVLHALHFLEQNGIVHGDVKPTNLLLDGANRVKLGDFGIARKMSGDEGSLVKGTTKYMAPEVVSDQFGQVGPHSDLYSLGFSAYELMCGGHFDSLFPGLNMFGRDQQIAWMMWHTAPDRRLPPIAKVLEGAPEDLAYCIERLCEKDPARRYRHAAEVIADLKEKATPAAKAAEEEAAKAEQQEGQQTKKRLIAVGALALSLALSLGIALMPRGGGDTQPPNDPATQAGDISAGVVEAVDLRAGHLAIAPSPGADPRRAQIEPELDKLLINDEPAPLSELRRGDKVTIERITSSAGGQERKYQRIHVTRAATKELAGVARSIALADQRITIASSATGGGETETTIYVPSTIEVRLNGEGDRGDRPYVLSDLQVGDRIVAEVRPGDKEHRATHLAALRDLSASGSLLRFSGPRRELTFRTADSDARTMPVAADVVVSLNDRKDVEGRMFTLEDLQSGDRVELEYDVAVKRIDAFREFEHVGVVSHPPTDDRRLAVSVEGRPRPVIFEIDPESTAITLPNGRQVRPEFLKPGDRLHLRHRSPGLLAPKAEAVTVLDLAPDPRTWAVVLGVSDYEDAKLTKIPHAERDADAVSEALALSYRVPADQLLSLTNPSKELWRQRFSEFLGRVARGSQLVVYIAAHGYLEAGVAYVAPKEFDFSRMPSTGIKLKEIIAAMEACPAAEKILLLDTCHRGTGRDLDAEPSPVELAESVKESPLAPVSTSVTVIAGCQREERGLTHKETKHGRFGAAIAEALSGVADADGRVSTDELFTHVSDEMEQANVVGAAQTPVRIDPNPNPERLPDEVKVAVRKMLGMMDRAGLGDDVITMLNQSLMRAQSLVPGEADPMMAYGLVLLKHGKTSASLEAFQRALAVDPEAAFAHQAVAWQQFNSRKYEDGVRSLTRMIESLETPPGDEEWDIYEGEMLRMAGILRQYALRVADPPLADDSPAIAEFNAAIKKKDARGLGYCGAGVKHVEAKRQTGPQRLNGLVSFYTTFDYNSAADYLKRRLEE